MTAVQFIPGSSVAEYLSLLRRKNPLIHCVTNEVVQEITANVLLAAGASPAMVVGEGEAEDFVGICDGLSINVGTPFSMRVQIMKAAARKARELGKPWVLDPVAAGSLVWRDKIIFELMRTGPDVIRGNASEIKFLAGQGSGGKGVDSTDSSDSAVQAAVELAEHYSSIVVVTGKTDYITDGTTTYSAEGGNPLITKVVGTGCSLSTLIAAFISSTDNKLEAAAACCAYVKKASEKAAADSHGPGSFHVAYLDALYNLKPEDFNA
ncbi:MAG: hydroxyethylthiazole kinase [Burkholderiales bacterium]|uniref:hydroxyethylthiazole kinase n=1 Tax=uncultured Turicimonas sp. TaxID=1918607 RepID=UPI001EB43EEC|nr:hydroxyethylthiazole kinase [uncultured Turicimonas sp.]MBS4846004.1 hydroxyethylthiazole kinase [Burkholderiales bacterium]